MEGMQHKILKSKREKLTIGIRAQTNATAARDQQDFTGRKKTLRKGNVVITGASSGLGLATAKSLAENGKWNAEKAAKSVALPKESWIMHLDLASLESVQFVDNFRRSGAPLDARLQRRRLLPHGL
ncbi:hypothetical protein HPP92_022209 [Vanilla planifolia]|uniref:Protochlorophyllide reductase n=1 Tax=Vanilla planifolia TaxID=51239 RepID=A0A835PT13_VANPL|nr:hypothetical protein HPP92_022209 [Vanilla planifolia]